MEKKEQRDTGFCADGKLGTRQDPLGSFSRPGPREEPVTACRNLELALTSLAARGDPFMGGALSLFCRCLLLHIVSAVLPGRERESSPGWTSIEAKRRHHEAVVVRMQMRGGEDAKG